MSAYTNSVVVRAKSASDANKIGKLITEFLAAHRLEAEVLLGNELNKNLRSCGVKSWRLTKCILSHMTKHSTYTLEDIKMFCELHNYKTSVAGPVIYKMLKENLIVRVARGHYSLPPGV